MIAAFLVTNGADLKVEPAAPIEKPAFEPQAAFPRLGRAVVTVDYDWLPAEAYRISLFSANAIAFDTEIAVASGTPEASAKTTAPS